MYEVLMNITGKQITAARAILGWTQQELADRAGSGVSTVASFEKGHRDTKTDTKEAIIGTLQEAGIEFLDSGVQFKPSRYEVFEGPDCYLRILDDIYYTLKDNPDEALFYCSDDRLSSGVTVEKELFIRRAGIRMRSIIEEGNTFIRYPLSEYRYIPKRYFNNHLTVTYGNKVALLFDINERAFVLENRQYAENQRNQFELIWSLHKQPKTTTIERIHDE